MNSIPRPNLPIPIPTNISLPTTLSLPTTALQHKRCRLHSSLDSEIPGLAYFSDFPELHSHSQFLQCWMRYVDDDKPLCDLSLPGTHDTTTYNLPGKAMCVAWDIWTQLNGGLRFLDIRIREDGMCYHNFVPTKVTFRSVLRDIERFLGQQPSECVLLRIKVEASHKEYVKQIATELSLKSSVLPTWTASTPLLKCRGKILPMMHNYISDLLPSYDAHDPHSISDWKNTYMDARLRDIQDFLNAHQKRDQVMFYSWWNANTEVTLEEPKDFAILMNKMALDYFVEKSKCEEFRAGVVVLDYPGEDLLLFIASLSLPLHRRYALLSRRAHVTIMHVQWASPPVTDPIAFYRLIEAYSDWLEEIVQTTSCVLNDQAVVFQTGPALFHQHQFMLLYHRDREEGSGQIMGMVATSALIDTSLTGLATTTKKLADTISKLSFDEKYQAKHRHEMRRPPKNALDAVWSGGIALGKGVYSGVTGLAKQPIKGAKEGGGKGFVMGVGRGMAGLVVKPTMGILDLTTRTIQSINSTGGSNSPRGDEEESSIRRRVFAGGGLSPVPQSPYTSDGGSYTHTPLQNNMDISGSMNNNVMLQ